jgi:putative flavoprotein involved in K+ transport
VDLLAGYARSAPVRTRTAVTAVRPTDRGYRVHTDDGTWHARTVVVAAGATAVPTRPAVPLPVGTVELTAADYRNPGSVPDGGVLVVGASASGVQIADELARAGRPVTLAVGEHVRMPRTYRGRDILWWMDASGLLDERWDAIPDLLRARRVPSMQLVGGSRTLDLAALRHRGVGLVGRLVGVRDATAQFSGSLTNVCALADLKLGRLLDRIDAWAARAGVDADPPQRFAPTPVPAPVLSAPLRSGGITSVVWATGFRPDLSFLGDAGVFDRRGRIVHDGGVTAAPGLYVLGLPFLRRRRSTLIDGAAADAHDLADHLAGHLSSTTDTAARRAS